MDEEIIKNISIAFSKRYCQCTWNCYTKSTESSMGKCEECRKIEVAISDARYVLSKESVRE